MKQTNRLLFNTQKNSTWQYSIKKLQSRHKMGTRTGNSCPSTEASCQDATTVRNTFHYHVPPKPFADMLTASCCYRHHHHSHSRVANMTATTSILLQEVLGALLHSNPAHLCDVLKGTQTKLAITRTQRQTQRPWRSWPEEPGIKTLRYKEPEDHDPQNLKIHVYQFYIM